MNISKRFKNRAKVWFLPGPKPKKIDLTGFVLVKSTEIKINEEKTIITFIFNLENGESVKQSIKPLSDSFVGKMIFRRFIDEHVNKYAAICYGIYRMSAQEIFNCRVLFDCPQAIAYGTFSNGKSIIHKKLFRSLLSPAIRYR